METNINPTSMNPAPTTHHREKYSFQDMKVGEPREGRTEAEAHAANTFSFQNKYGVKLKRRRQPDGTYTIWRVE